MQLALPPSGRVGWAPIPPVLPAIYRMLLRTDLASELARIACPVLLIAGTLDATRPPSAVTAIADSINNARYLLLPTGHYAAIQTPERRRPTESARAWRRPPGGRGGNLRPQGRWLT